MPDLDRPAGDLQLSDPTPEQASALTCLRGELRFALVTARSLAIINARCDVARSEAVDDSSGHGVTQRVLDEVREQVLDDTTSFPYFLGKVAERIEEIERGRAA